MEEIWKPIEGYENFYEVSSEGRVRSVDREVVCSDGSKHFYKGQIKKQQMGGGYLHTYLKKNGTAKWFYTHRLVAKAFLPNPDNLPFINHKDEVKTNNVVDNLEWCDRSYNATYGTAIERRVEKQSKKVYQYTLDNQLVKIWESAHECSRNGYSLAHVTACGRGERKTHKGFKWSYKPLEAHINLSNNLIISPLLR